MQTAQSSAYLHEPNKKHPVQENRPRPLQNIKSVCRKSKTNSECEGEGQDSRFADKGQTRRCKLEKIFSKMVTEGEARGSREEVHAPVLVCSNSAFHLLPKTEALMQVEHEDQGKCKELAVRASVKIEEPEVPQIQDEGRGLEVVPMEWHVQAHIQDREAPIQAQRL